MKPVDRLPFWPKLDGKYPQAQEARYHGMSANEMHDLIGSDRHDWIGNCVKEKCGKTSVSNSRNGNESRTLYETPGGRLEMVCLFDEASNSWHPVKFPVERAEDIPLMTQIYEDLSSELDAAQLKDASKTYRDIGDKAVVGAGVGKSPLMHWIEWIAGVENAHYLLADETDRAEESRRNKGGNQAQPR
jgi:hypothetical protein